MTDLFPLMTVEEQKLFYPELEALGQKLISIGGTGAKIELRPGKVQEDLIFIGELIKRGVVFFPDEFVLIPGELNQCHKNVREYLKWHKKTEWMFGYALLDNLWERHSWIRDGGKLLETTITRDKYCGLPLRRSSC